MRKRTGVVLGLALVVLAAAMPAAAQFDPDPGGGGGGGGGGTYCSQPQCGCSAPSGFYVCGYSCSCSSLQQTRSCTYCPVP